ncbi:hypothetical protein ACT80S_00315 [Ramlibacter sp. MAHUQ-53]|uniref:hypothetical protein n=1 Tax=unclassified Ramlibacter TaxID=2617605 RepID=UPI003627ECFF
MYLVAIGWLYVALMMSVAEATAANGSLLGAIVTFVLYGLVPTGLLVYLLGTPARKRKLKEKEAAELAAWRASQAAASGQPDTGGQAPADAVTPVRKEP